MLVDPQRRPIRLHRVPREDVEAVRESLSSAGIRCTRIGEVDEGPARVVIDDGREGTRLLPWPERDEIGRAF